MNQAVTFGLTSIGIFAGILVAMEFGRRIGARRALKQSLIAGDEKEQPGLSAIDGAVFGLMGLLLAFAFSGAVTRWDAKRDQVVTESNAIGTAWLRIDLLPASAQPEMRDLFRSYLDSRIMVYALAPDIDAMIAELARATELQGRIWRLAIASGDDSSPATNSMLLLLPALNEMFDVASERSAAAFMHPPTIIYILLFALIFASAFLTGNSLSSQSARPWSHMIAFAIVLAATIYVILDLEFPRLGLIRLDAIDQLMIDLRRSMK